MKRLNTILTTSLLSLILHTTTSVDALAQADSTALLMIETIDGNQYIGVIHERTDAAIQLDTQNLGLLTIPLEEIKKTQEISPDRIKKGQYWADNPQATRYFWAPNGFSLKPNEGYYQNVWVFFNHVSVGVSENVSVGAGLVPTFLFGGAPTPVWITPKVSFPVTGSNSRLHFGAGALVATVLGESSGTLGIAYGVMTIGTRDDNVNLGVGMGFASGEVADYPTVSLSAMTRLSKRGYLITENYFIPTAYGGFGLLSAGGRLVGKNMSFDFGLVVPIEEGEIYYALPWLGIAVPMGQ